MVSKSWTLGRWTLSQTLRHVCIRMYYWGASRWAAHVPRRGLGWSTFLVEKVYRGAYWTTGKLHETESEVCQCLAWKDQEKRATRVTLSGKDWEKLLIIYEGLLENGCWITSYCRKSTQAPLLDRTQHQVQWSWQRWAKPSWNRQKNSCQTWNAIFSYVHDSGRRLNQSHRRLNRHGQNQNLLQSWEKS